MPSVNPDGRVRRVTVTLACDTVARLDAVARGRRLNGDQGAGVAGVAREAIEAGLPAVEAPGWDDGPVDLSTR